MSNPLLFTVFGLIVSAVGFATGSTLVGFGGLLFASFGVALFLAQRR